MSRRFWIIAVKFKTLYGRWVFLQGYGVGNNVAHSPGRGEHFEPPSPSSRRSCADLRANGPCPNGECTQAIWPIGVVSGFSYCEYGIAAVENKRPCRMWNASFFFSIFFFVFIIFVTSSTRQHGIRIKGRDDRSCTYISFFFFFPDPKG